MTRISTERWNERVKRSAVNCVFLSLAQKQLRIENCEQLLVFIMNALFVQTVELQIEVKLLNVLEL